MGPAPRKILMTTDAVGGVWTYAMELSRVLGGHGVEVVLAVMGPAPDADQCRAAAGLANVTMRQGPYRLEWMDEPWDHVARAGEWLLGLEEEHRPDVVHLSGYVHGSLAWRAPTLVVGHSCVLSWWEAVKGVPAPAAYTRYKAEVTRGLRAAAAVVAPSHAMARALQRHYGPLPAVRVIANARDRGMFKPLVKEPYVLTAGRLWDEAKNVSAIHAAAGLVKWPVYVAGDEQLSADGPAAAKGRCARCLGRLSAGEMADRLGRASVYALPARYEPFGLSVLEAAMAGCALVLGDIPSLRENWSGAAAFVPPDDHNALARALDRLATDEDRRQTLALLARDRAQTFAPARMAAEYLSTYRGTLAADRTLNPQAAGDTDAGAATARMAATTEPR